MGEQTLKFIKKMDPELEKKITKKIDKILLKNPFFCSLKKAIKWNYPFTTIGGTSQGFFGTYTVFIEALSAIFSYDDLDEAEKFEIVYFLVEHESIHSILFKISLEKHSILDRFDKKYHFNELVWLEIVSIEFIRKWLFGG